jgi:hypothetical protein
LLATQLFQLNRLLEIPGIGGGLSTRRSPELTDVHFPYRLFTPQLLPLNRQFEIPGIGGGLSTRRSPELTDVHFPYRLISPQLLPLNRQFEIPGIGGGLLFFNNENATILTMKMLPPEKIVPKN